MTRAVETLTLQIEEDSQTITIIRNQVAYNRAQLAQLPKKWDEHRIKLERSNLDLTARELKVLDGIRESRQLIAKYQHEWDLLEMQNNLKKQKMDPEEAKAPPVTIDPKEQAFFQT